MVRLIVLLIGYAFGLFQTSYIYGRLHGIDIRKTGSGNAGTTNALRTLGKKAGIIVMIGDIVKCILAVVVVYFLFGRKQPEIDYLLRVYTGFGAILGHNFPFYMGFKGGKGVASMAGVINTISLPITIIGNISFFSTIAITHYVSLASLIVAAEFLIGTIIQGQLGMFHMNQAHLIEMYIVVGAIVGLVVFQHRGNIHRLLTNTERKTYIFKKNS
jgi:glycerol-3-phosphate acyltransferase PlsY